MLIFIYFFVDGLPLPALDGVEVFVSAGALFFLKEYELFVVVFVEGDFATAGDLAGDLAGDFGLPGDLAGDLAAGLPGDFAGDFVDFAGRPLFLSATFSSTTSFSSSSSSSFSSLFSTSFSLFSPGTSISSSLPFLLADSEEDLVLFDATDFFLLPRAFGVDASIFNKYNKSLY